MITFKIERDQARTLQQYFFPYLDEYCRLKQRDSIAIDEQLTQFVIFDLYRQVKVIIEKKLLTVSHTLKVNLTDSQAAVFHKLLLALPLDGSNVWMVYVRQLICNIIYPVIEREIARIQEKAKPA